MAAVYTKEFLLDAFCFRYDEYNLNTRNMRAMASRYYDTVPKQKFRDSCSLDAQELQRYKNFCLEVGIEY